MPISSKNLLSTKAFLNILSLLALSFLIFLSTTAFAEDVAPSFEEHTQLQERQIVQKHTAHHSDGGLPQLNANTYSSQIFWLIVIFGFLYFFVVKAPLTKISEIKSEREIRIEKDQEMVSELQKKSHNIKEEYEKALKDAREKARLSYNETLKKVQTQALTEKQKLEEQLSKKIENLSIEIQETKQKSIVDIQNIAEQLTLQIIQKFGYKLVSDEKIKKAVHIALEEKIKNV